MEKLNQIYEGKAKILYSTANSNQLVQYFKDEATAFNAQKKAVIENKGILNNFLSEFFMLQMEKNSIPTHFIQRLNQREQLIKKAKIFALEVIIRNVSAGSLSKKLGIDEGVKFSQPIFEICYKNDALQDPLINDDYALYALKILSSQQLKIIKDLAFKINEILTKIFYDVGILLVDFKIEFGLDCNDNKTIILADEISPDSCRLWDKDTLEKLDKDRFRRDLGGLCEAYLNVANRLKISIN